MKATVYIVSFSAPQYGACTEGLGMRLQCTVATRSTSSLCPTLAPTLSPSCNWELYFCCMEPSLSCRSELALSSLAISDWRLKQDTMHWSIMLIPSCTCSDRRTYTVWALQLSIMLPVLHVSFIIDHNVLHMWQSRVKIEGYSVAYFDRIAAFKVPYCWTSIKGRAHMRFLDLLDIHASTKHVWAPPLMEVQRYSASNTAMRSKYTTE